MKNKFGLIDIFLIIIVVGLCIYEFNSGNDFDNYFIYLIMFLPARTLYYYNHKILSCFVLLLVLSCIFFPYLENVFNVPEYGLLWLISVLIYTINYLISWAFLVLIPILLLIKYIVKKRANRGGEKNEK